MVAREATAKDEADRWAKLTLLSCPECSLSVLTLDVPMAKGLVWPVRERTTTRENGNLE